MGKTFLLKTVCMLCLSVIGAANAGAAEQVIRIPEMIHIAGGAYRTAGDPDKDIAPKDYKVKEFWIGKYEITFGQFDPFCYDTLYYHKRMGSGIDTPLTDFWRESIWKATQREGVEPPEHPLEDYPVIQVCWLDACAYCLWLTEKTGVLYRLPTQVEWEYACTAGGKDTAIDPNRLGKFAWFAASANRRDGRPQIRPVGSKKPNSLGLHDMLGNVWEWCLDGPTPLDYPDIVGEWNRISKQHSPLDMTTRGSPYWKSVSLLFHGPKGNAKALRGGAWCEFANRVTPTYRMFYRSNYAASRVGFRVVCTEDPSHHVVLDGASTDQ